MQLKNSEQASILLELLFGLAVTTFYLGTCFSLSQQLFRELAVQKKQLSIRQEISTHAIWQLENLSTQKPETTNFELICSQAEIANAYDCRVENVFALAPQLMEFKLIK